ncbi:MAG: riboflavin synthase subunit alpha [Planctomycetota bacterium]|nr:MAG: riboflavin synthase subunit alpha [Planctomycetota bacterium]
MFTGLVESVGEVQAAERRPGGGMRLVVALGELAEGLRPGDSVAVSGCCLTAVAIEGQRAAFDLVPETLARTWFARLRPGVRVNLELPLRLGDRLGGHLVQGHVDGLATIVERAAEGGAGGQVRLVCEAPPALLADMVPKGSVALDGVSLTLVEVEPPRFSVALIPHTLAVTTLGERQPGDPLNVETDLLAKWLRRLAAPYLEPGR